MTNHSDMVQTLAKKMGIPTERVIKALRTKQQLQPLHDEDGDPLFNSVDGHTSDEGLVVAAFRAMNEQ